MKAELYNQKNEVVGELALPAKLFGATWKPALVSQVLLAQSANLRRPWAHAKGRGEVRGGGRKPWRQKGTGRARHGSIRSPLWSGGGKAHGPNKERDYSQKVNKKMKRAALASVLSKKFAAHDVKFFDSFDITEAKTKFAAQMLRPLLGLTPKQKKFNVLLVPTKDNKNFLRAVRNLPKAKVLMPDSLNVYDVLNSEHIFVDSRTLATIEGKSDNT